MRIIFLVLTILGGLSFGYSQNVNFVAKVDNNKVTENETFTITYELNTVGGDFTLPDVKPLSIIAGPSRSSSTYITNGKRTDLSSFSITLFAKEKGIYNIPPATISVKGKPIKSNPIRIEVIESESVKSLEGTGVTFIRMETSDTVAYIGQRIILKYQLYTKEDVAGLDLKSQSDFQAFHTETGDSPRGYKQEKINGQDYYSRTILTYYLYPQKTGLFTLDPYVLQIAKPIAGGRRGIFGRTETKSKLYYSNDLKIEVKELPSGAPETFSGAVGKYAMEASVRGGDYTTDDAIQMEMAIQGTGDAKSWGPPSQVISGDVETYEPKIIDERPYNSQWGTSTYKKIEYNFLPRSAGKVNITPSFTYFDTDSLAYVTLEAAQRTFLITEGEGSDIETGLDEEFSVESTDREDNRNVILFLIPLLLMGIGGAYFILKGKKKEEVPVDHEALRKSRAKKIAIAALSRADQYITEGDEKGFYTEVSLALNRYLGDKYNILSKERTIDNISATLKSNQVSDTKIEEYLAIMKKCELAIYAKHSASDMQALYSRAVQLIQSMED